MTQKVKSLLVQKYWNSCLFFARHIFPKLFLRSSIEKFSWRRYFFWQPRCLWFKSQDRKAKLQCLGILAWWFSHILGHVQALSWETFGGTTLTLWSSSIYRVMLWACLLLVWTLLPEPPTGGCAGNQAPFEITGFRKECRIHLADHNEHLHFNKI